MAAPVNATINIFANTDQAVAQFRSLQAQVATLNKTVAATSGAAVAQQAALNKALMDGANASRMWNARIVPMNTAVGQFSDALDKGRMSLGQYTRHAASQLPGMSRVFKREFDMMSRVAEANVKRMQTQYVALGKSATGASQAMAFTPTALNQQAASTQIAAQRQMMMNRMIDLGTTKLLNWGKNTQWAGRQLMVGFSIPLAMMGAAAAKAFKEIDKGEISFKRVYGDLQTTTAEMEKNLEAVKSLGTEYMKYGKSLASTIEIAADVAATGARNESLIAATEQTLRLATLGLMEYDDALEATVSIQTAFKVSNEDLAETIDFLNVVENETILTMQDMAEAIPRVAPVIKGLGGDVKDLAVFMTALREGGVSAEQGANALKSGLGRLINPTKAAREEAEKYGISIETIVQRNRGDLMGTVTEFGDAIKSLGQLEQQQLLQKVFGTYQYARLGALFSNLSNDAGQAQRTIDLTAMSVEDLAKISERELGKIEEATSVKFQAAIEQLKVSIAPIGETFLKALTPILDFISKMLNAFNDLPDNVKNIIALTIGAVAGLGPIVLMTVGLIANGIANIGKLIQVIRKFFARLKGDASLFNYLTKEEQEATAAANTLSGATDTLTGKFVGQQRALERLIQLVGTYAKSLSAAATAAPLGMGVGSAAAMSGAMAKARGGTQRAAGPSVGGSGEMRMAKGGVVPGTGNKDTVPAMLTPGESVVTKEATQKYGPMIQAMNDGTRIPGFVQGVVNVAGASSGIPMQLFKTGSAQTISRMADQVVRELVEDGVAIDRALDKVTRVLTDFATTGQRLSNAAAKKLFEQEGLTRSSRTMVAAHLTNPMPYSDPRTQAAIAQQSAAFQDFARENPNYVRATSKLTALLPGLLNQQMAPGRSGANFKDFRAGWKLAGKDTLLNAASMTDDTIRGDAEAGKALRKMAGDIGRRSIQVAKAAGLQKVQDEHLATATQQVVDKYKSLGGSSARAAAALERAASQVGQLRVNVPASAVRQGLASGEYIERGRSVVTRTGVEVARDRGARAAGNIPVAGGLATATAQQQAEVLAKVMASNGPVVAGAYYSTNTPAMVAGAARTAQQMAQTQNRVLEDGTQDIAMIARDRNSPHPIVAKDAVEDARMYAARIKQTLMSMMPVTVPGGMIQATPPNIPQGTKLPGAGTGQAYNPSNNPQGLGVPRLPIPVEPRKIMGAIESKEGVYRRQQAEERRLQQEQEKTKVVDNRRTGAMREQVAVLGKQTTWLERSIQSQQQLERQKQLNITAQEQASQAQLRLNAATQREAVMKETMNQRPARGGILDKPIGALRRVAFPGGQDAALKNLGFNQFSGEVKSAGKLILESAKEIKTRVSASIKTLPADFKRSTQELLKNAKLAGSALRTDFKALGSTIKTNMLVDLKTLTSPIVATAGALRTLGASAGQAAQRMAGGVGNFMNSVDKNGTSRLQKMGQAGNGAVMGLMGLSMAASFAGGSVGEMAQKIMPVTMGLMGLQMILPMFTNPMGLAIIAITALVGTFIWMRKSLDEAAKSAAEFAASQGGAANRMEATSEALQYEFATQRVGERGFRFSEEDKKAQSEFSSYFESEGGQKFIQGLENATSEERFAKIASQISFAIADGLDPERAKAFAQGIAAEIGDSLLNSRIAGLFASGQLRSGSSAMIDLIKQRQEASMGNEIVSADYRAQMSTSGRLLKATLDPVGEAINSLTRPIAEIAGTANTTTDVLGKAALEIGTFTAAGAGIGAVAGAIGGPVAGITATLGAVGGFFAGLAKVAYTLPKELDALEKNSASVAAAFGSTIQILKEVDNAEALLLEERRKGIITAQEYAEEEAKLNAIKNKQAKILGKAIEALVDEGANEQAIVDQLVLANFDEDTAGAIARATDREKLAAQLFDGKAYGEIGAEGQNFVNTVIADLLTGITPENAQTRIAEVGVIYKDIAQQIVNGAVEGMTLENLDLASLQGLSEKERYAAATESILGNEIITTEDGRNTNAQVVGNITAGNMMALEDVFLDLEVTGQEVFNTLASFGDPALIAKIGMSEDGLTRVATALSLLADYPSIDIELLIKENIDPQNVLDGLEKIKDFKFNKKLFGDNVKEIQRTSMSGEQFVKVLQETGNLAGKTGDQISGAYGKALDSYDKVVDEIGTNKLGNININANLITKLFGKEMPNGEAIANAMKAAMPDGLPSISAQILLSIAANDPVTAALLANPAIMKAVLAGKDTYEVPYYSAGQGGIQDVALPGPAAALAGLFKGLEGTTAPALDVPTGKKPEDTSGSGGSKEKTALEELEESIAERAALYLSVTKKGEKLDKNKKGYLNRLAAQTTTNNSIASQLAKLNLSETIIADILAMGSKKAAEIIKQLGPSGLQRLNVADVVSRAGQFLEGQRSERTKVDYRNTARTRLEQTGQFTEEEIEDILEDEEATEILATLPKKYKKLWKEFIQSLRDTADATAEIETEAEKLDKAFDKASDRLSILNDMMSQGFDAAEIEAADRVASKFFTDNTVLAGKLAKSTGHTITNGYELAEAMERQVSLNEKLIDQEQDKVDKKQEEINDYERTNSLIQQGIDNLRRQDEIRNRVSESLSRDLEQISQAEEKIRESYQDRIDALDKVSKINSHIIQQQQKQINLSRAVSEGDIYAATQAVQEMRAASAQQAAEQTRLGLERGMEAEIEGLTNAEGMTRVQIEEEISNIKEQSYQNSLLIRIEEDKIYANSLEVRRLSNEIYNIQEDLIEPLQNQNKEYGRMLDYYKDDQAYQVGRVTLAGMTREQFEKQADALDLAVKNARDLDPELLTLVGRYDAIANAARAAAAEAAKLGTGIAADQYTGPVVGQSSVGFTGMDFSGMDFSGIDFSGLANLDFSGIGGLNLNSGGMVLGEGSRDSISAMLTPGEFVVRKAMVDKYGTPLMNALNQGSFNMPTYNTGPDVPEVGAINNTTVSSVNAPVYNTYDMKFSISGTSQSADEIANKVMFKMKQVQDQGIRSNRGY